MQRRVLQGTAAVGVSLVVSASSVLLFGAVVRTSETLSLPPAAGLASALVAATLPVLPVAAAMFRPHPQAGQRFPRERAAPATDRVPDWLPEARRRAWQVFPISTRPLDPRRPEE
jgi:hypothetical protein